MIRVGLAAAALAALAAYPASAALFVSGDPNIVNNLTTHTPNQVFFDNIIDGATVLIRGSEDAFWPPSPDLEAYLDGAGYAATAIDNEAAITAADLAGVDFFIALGTDIEYSAPEIALLSAFMAGGGDVLITGENSNYAHHNIRLNALLEGLGSGMRIVTDQIDFGFHTANILTDNAYTAGTAGFEYALTSRVTGGTALYGTQFTNATFLAFEDLRDPGGAVPEPGTWALMIAGFGLAGAALRRRRIVLA